MKKISGLLITFIIIFLSFFSSGNVFAQAPSEYITVKVIQTLNDRFSVALIAFADGTVEQVDLPRIKAMGQTNLDKSSETVIKILNRLRGKGYELASNGAGFADGGFYEVYVFKK